MTRRRTIWETPFTITSIPLGDAAYPELLATIPDPPERIYAAGQLDPSVPLVAVVGTRKPTEFGRVATDRLVRMLARNGYGIVSGLAYGIDVIAHQAALAVGGYTIAVLGHGLDHLYPVQHKDVAQRIVDRGGALLSEQPADVGVSPLTLIARDRIQSGLSCAVIVGQTPVSGGTMHTIEAAVRQERQLFALSPPPGIHRDVDASAGLVALTTLTGPQFGRAAGAEGTYREVLTKVHSKRPLAMPITGKDSYPALLKQIELCWNKQRTLAAITMSSR